MPAWLDLRVGIDVGGTNTDAIVLDENDVLIARHKTPTTEDLGSGIYAALESVIAQIDAPTERISHVMLGTTHATNAILERRDLLRVGVIRIGAPATLSIPPLMDWPADLRSVVSVGEVIVGGGSEVSGAELVALDESAIEEFAHKVRAQAQAFAITSVFSPVSADHELRAAEIVRDICGVDVPISMSHNIGSLGLLERENACVLNAALVGSAQKVVRGLTDALQTNGIDATVYFTQNDGTLMNLDYVLRFPVLTIGSGPANSMRGAGYLAKLRDAVVVDVGGTSSDVGVLIEGFPRQSTTPVDIGGVRTNFRMLDLISTAIGGGTRVDYENDIVRVGPESVGYRIRTEALVFGGSTPTLTDAAVLAGRVDLGDRSLADGHAGPLRSALAVADGVVADASDQIKTSRKALPVIVVGGGSVILPDRIDGAGEVVRPDHYDVANAIGAAIAAVSGEVDKVFDLDGRTRQQVVELACQAAINEAISAGADPGGVEIVEIEEVPMAYLTTPVVRIRVKAAGPLARV